MMVGSELTVGVGVERSMPVSWPTPSSGRLAAAVRPAGGINDSLFCTFALIPGGFGVDVKSTFNSSMRENLAERRWQQITRPSVCSLSHDHQRLIQASWLQSLPH
jgi:hypothetical protein